MSKLLKNCGFPVIDNKGEGNIKPPSIWILLFLLIFALYILYDIINIYLNFAK